MCHLVAPVPQVKTWGYSLLSLRDIFEILTTTKNQELGIRMTPLSKVQFRYNYTDFAQSRPTLRNCPNKKRRNK